MSRTFKAVDYEAAHDLTVRLGDCLPPDHLACFVVDMVALLDLSALYARYGSRGGEPYAPEVLFALLVYGYATGVFSSRKIERATDEAIPFRFIAGTRHPDHDTLATFRATFLPEIKALFVQVLLLAQEAGVLRLGTLSLDGTKIDADASKSKAVSDKRLLELEAQLRAEVEELFALAERTDERERPDGLVVRDEIARREGRLAGLREARAAYEERARERDALEQAAYEEKLAQRAEKERATGRRLGGRAPTPATPGPRAGDQYNVTDPDARIMKNPTDAGGEQDDNAQIAVDQQSLLIVGLSLSTHPNDTHEAEPTLVSIPPEVGAPDAAAMDHGYGGPATLEACARRGIEPYIATGRDPHHQSGQQRFAPCPPRRRRTPRPRSGWPTSSRPPRARRSTARANTPSSPSWASSPKSRASGRSRSGAQWLRRASGVWSAWPSISSGPIPSRGRSGAAEVGATASCSPQPGPAAL